MERPLETIDFQPPAVTAYLDRVIEQTRHERETAWLNKDLDRWVRARARMDAYQSVRLNLFGSMERGN